MRESCPSVLTCISFWPSASRGETGDSLLPIKRLFPVVNRYLTQPSLSGDSPADTIYHRKLWSEAIRLNSGAKFQQETDRHVLDTLNFALLLQIRPALLVNGPKPRQAAAISKSAEDAASVYDFIVLFRTYVSLYYSRSASWLMLLKKTISYPLPASHSFRRRASKRVSRTRPAAEMNERFATRDSWTLGSLIASKSNWGNVFF